ncbi:uncharacterized protein LOC123518156 isoform X1 [Portunus trituberculatus]|uniref:uncharacterized protein LOC123518156 isoform X1 n=1 Tax=Portunus trituberculatus TaxID=210409 RepID=UPI001E1CE280|nr:uncharacterized protein LOC123518156 isoform X1 [Portunus trituberculatus]
MNHSDVKMAWRQASACLSLVVWVCCTNVCVVSAKGKSPVHSKGPISDRLATASDIGNVTAPSSTLPAADTARKILLTTDDGTDSQQEAENSHRHVGSSVKNSSDGEAPVTEAASKRNTSVQGGGSGGDGGVSAIIRGLPPSSSSSSATAEQLRSATSLAGTLALLLISVVIAGALFVMVICFIHKWRENMGTGRYPRVVYSMLRQSEDEPEDVLGEILINIGLAAPGDTRPLTPSSSSSSSRCSPAPADPEMDINDLEGTKFTTIPLRSDEAAKRLMVPEPEESDEELLQ